MTEKPLFSIIIATYNRAHLLPRAINSVLSQSYQDFELIIVDDGSSDNTEELVKSFKDKKIIYYKFKENKGLSVVWNKGFDLAKGDYVALLDDDDELLPEALETAADKFAELSPRGIKIIWFDCVDFTSGKIAGKGINKDGYISADDYLCRRVEGDFWLVIDRTLLATKGNRFDERTLGGAKLLWYELCYQTKVFHVAKILYVVHREHGSTMTYDFRVNLKFKQKYLWTNKTFLENYGNKLEKLCPHVYGRCLASLGFSQIINGEKAEGRRTLVKSLRFRLSVTFIILALLSFVLSEKQIAFLAIKYNDAKYYIKERYSRLRQVFVGRRPNPPS